MNDKNSTSTERQPARQVDPLVRAHLTWQHFEREYLCSPFASPRLGEVWEIDLGRGEWVKAEIIDERKVEKYGWEYRVQYFGRTGKLEARWWSGGMRPNAKLCERGEGT